VIDSHKSFSIRHIALRGVLYPPPPCQCDILWVSALGGLPLKPSFHRAASSFWLR
jgi:hypothetical protein